jgi:hypothetical protein
MNTKINPKDVAVNASRNYSRFLDENLTVAEAGALPELLGVSKHELSYNLGRPQRMSREMIYKMAEVIHGTQAAAADLVTVYGLGRERLTIAEAEEMQALTQQTAQP